MTSVRWSKVWAAAAVVVVAILAALVAVLAPDDTFRQGYLAGLFATLIGVAVAIPLGLAADRWRGRSEQSERRTKLVQAIRDDLVAIREDLAGRRRDRSVVTVPFLGSGLWEAVAASGKIGDIDDPIVLRSIARAYDRIGVTRYLEKQLWELTIGTVIPDPMSTPLGDRPPAPRISVARQALVDQDRHTEAAISVALEQLPKAL